MANMSLPWLDAAVLSDLSESLSRTQRTSFRLDQSRKGIVSKEPRAQARAVYTVYSINCSNAFKLVVFQATKKHCAK